jgi:K+-sensing histidine kinase KdpD
MLSHDLKNPLTAAIGSIDLVREKRLGQINREQAGYLLRQLKAVMKWWP